MLILETFQYCIKFSHAICVGKKKTALKIQNKWETVRNDNISDMLTRCHWINQATLLS